MREIKVGGKYKHYKGNFYEVIAVVRDSEDPQKEFVVYKALYDSPEFGPNQVLGKTERNVFRKSYQRGKNFLSV